MTCERVTSMILDYLSGEMAKEHAEAFEAHLRLCPDCVAFLATYRKTVHLARSIRYADIPPEMRRRVRAFLRCMLTASRSAR